MSGGSAAPPRLQKLLAAAGVGSRRAVEALIRAGRVTVNGVPASLGDRADPERDEIRVDGRPVGAEAPEYWLVHKPRGVLSAARDDRGRQTVVELVSGSTARLYPVGRLDLDSEGLVLLTNDGALTFALLHPSRGHERVYEVEVSGRVDAGTLRRLTEGVSLEDGPSRALRAELRGPAAAGGSELIVTMGEGRKRQVRRMLAAVGHPVRRLRRVRLGPLALGDLAPGESRRLSAPEAEALRAAVLAP